MKALAGQLIGSKNTKKGVDMAEQLKEMEINLYDYLEIMRKYKKIIIFVLTVSVIMSFGMLYRAIRLCPEMFKVIMFIEPGTIEIKDDGKKIPLDSTEEINKRIKNRVFRWGLNKEVETLFLGVSLNFDVSNPEETDLIEVTSIQEKDSVAKCIDLMNDLFVKLSDDNSERIKSQKRKIKLQLENVNTAIKTKENMIKLQKKNLEIFNQTEEKLRTDIKMVENNIKELAPLRRALAERENGVAVNYLSPDIILDNVNFSRKLEDQRDKILSEKEEIVLLDIKCVEQEIEDLNSQKDYLFLSEANIRNIMLYRQPKAERFILDKKKWVYPAGGIVIGLIIGLFIAFSMESWRKYKGTL